jgi:hypothetical protein
VVSEETILEIERSETRIAQCLLADGDEMRFIWRSGLRGEHRQGVVKNGGEFRCSRVKSGKSIVDDRGKKQIYVKVKRLIFISDLDIT